MFVPADFKDATMAELKSALQNDGFDTYLTSVGGSGLGILSPYNQRAPSDAPPTPPSDSSQNTIEVVDEAPDPLRSSLDAKPLGELSAWADSLGRWLFV